MRKKLTAQGTPGRQSYTVTLPIEWIKEHKLEKKREVELSQIGQNIILSTQKKEKPVFLSDKEYHEGIVKILRALYRRGVDEIHFQASNKNAQEIRRAIDSFLIGYEIVEQKNNVYIIKDITGENPEGFDITLRRIFRILTTIAEEFDEASFRSLQKLCVYAQRILSKHGHEEYQKTPFYYLIIDRIEKIADEYAWMKNSKNKALKKLLEETHTLLYRFNSKEYIKAQEQSYKLKNTLKGNEHNIARLINSLLGDVFAAVGEP